MPSSENRWIISKKKFHEHVTPDTAIEEMSRLQGKFPGEKFRMYRIKRDVDHPAADTPPIPFPDADVPITLTGREWTALLGRIVYPHMLTDTGRTIYREASTKIREQLLAASARHPSTHDAAPVTA